MNFVGDVAVLAVPTMILIAFYILGFAVSWGPICPGCLSARSSR